MGKAYNRDARNKIGEDFNPKVDEVDWGWVEDDDDEFLSSDRKNNQETDWSYQ